VRTTFLSPKRNVIPSSVMRTRFLQRPNRSEGSCGKACTIEGAEEPQGPSGLLPPQACNTGPLGDPGTRALKKARARFTAVRDYDLSKNLGCVSSHTH